MPAHGDWKGNSHEHEGEALIEQASFSLRGRNPDVLTCIANLSNNEAFTPPEFANLRLGKSTPFILSTSQNHMRVSVRRHVERVSHV